MAFVKPFKGIFYNQKKVNLSNVVTLPYDVIGPEKRKKYFNLDKNSFINLILPSGDGDEKYEYSKKLFEDWLNEDILLEDQSESFYLYQEDYLKDGIQKSQKGLLCLVRIEPFESGIILPHEEIYGGPMEDRYKLLKETKADLEPIMGIYTDPAKTIKKICESSEQPELLIDLNHVDDIRHRIWRIDDEMAIGNIKEAISDKKIIIADGHHRYTTALKYHIEDDKGDSYLLMWLLDIDDTYVYPTHRLINCNLSDYPNFKTDLASFFDLEEVNSKKELLEKITYNGESKHLFGLYSKNLNLILTLKDNPLVHRALEDNGKTYWRKLDVNILHSIIIKKILGIPEDTKHIRFIKDSDKLFEKVDAGIYGVGLLLNATKIQQVVEISLSGKRLPQKSTYFYPKPLSGLILRKHE